MTLDISVASLDSMEPDYGRFLIHGRQGSGKTSLASTIAEVGKTLLIDLTGERGVRSIQGSPYSSNIDVYRPASVTELDDLFWKLAQGGHGYRAVILDSLTALQKMTMRFLMGHDETAVREIRQGVAPADMRTWGQALDIMTDTATFWFSLADSDRPEPMHVIMTAQTKITDSDDGAGSIKIPDVQKGALSITLATPDYVLYTDVEDNLDAIADPSLPAVNHIVRFGSDPEYRIKARVPQRLRGKIPEILGRKKPTSLPQLGRVLGIGGMVADPQPGAVKVAGPVTEGNE